MSVIAGHFGRKLSPVLVIKETFVTKSCWLWKKKLCKKIKMLLNLNEIKICLSVFDMDNLVSGSKVGLSKKFKDSGVKRVFLVAAVPDTPENY